VTSSDAAVTSRAPVGACRYALARRTVLPPLLVLLLLLLRLPLRALMAVRVMAPRLAEGQGHVALDPVDGCGW